MTEIVIAIGTGVLLYLSLVVVGVVGAAAFSIISEARKK